MSETRLPARQIGPISFAVCESSAAQGRVLAAVRDGEARVFAFCNMHTYNLAQRDPALARAMSGMTVFNDGVGIDFASRLLHGQRFPANLNGTDFTPALLGALPTDTPVFLVGSPPGIAEDAAGVLTRRFPSMRIVGCEHGYFDPAQSDELVQRIVAAGTRLLIVGMGNPRQELWATEIAERVGSPVLCVGAYLDFESGRIPRAPRIVRQLRMEWFYRLAREPRRLARRYLLGGPVFLWTILREKWRADPTDSLSSEAAP